jgi:carboxypeptidase PM20D1
MRKLILVLAASVLLLAGFMLTRAARYRGDRTAAAEPAPKISIPDGAAERLAGSLRIATISHEDPAAFDPAAFQALHAYLQSSYPKVHAHLEREVVGGHSLLYTWRGSDPSLPALLLAGHLDVVPVEPGTEGKWREPPFDGRVAGGFIWGRGAIDNKSAVVGTLEAVEMLVGEGFQPARTVLLAYGHDEEVGGTRGARGIATLLKTRGTRLETVLDEGGVIGQGILPGLSAPVALVGVAEKGFLSVELSARTAGGHSSLPPPQSAIGLVSAAIARLEAHPLPARLEGPTRRLFDRVGPHFPFAQRLVFANLWLTRPLVTRRLAGSPATNAMVRTTTAVTVFQAGTKDNVLPSYARAVVNFRILPGDSQAAVLEHVRRAIDDRRIEVEATGAFSAEPSSVSSSDSEGFRAIERAIRSVAPDAIVAPYLVVVVTDARYYAGLSRDVYRFLPLRMAAPDLDRIHGINERISVPNYEDAIRTYRQLIVNAAGP